MAAGGSVADAGAPGSVLQGWERESAAREAVEGMGEQRIAGKCA